jgi:4-coumarate--CoA ligase
MGYLNEPAATQATFDAEGFLHTGDIGAISQDGFVTIHDRLKEMIKVRDLR